MVSAALLWVAVAGLTGATIFLGLVLAAARRFQNSKRGGSINAESLPPVTLLKPVHGAEPRLRENLESFFRLNYSRYEIIFGARYADDAALAVVEALRRQYPDVPVKVVLAGEPNRPSAKICALEKMVAVAAHEFVVISDSDVHVAPNYIQEVVHPLMNPAVGLVTCVYRGVPTRGLWSRLEGLGMSVEMTSGVLVADMLEGMKFALGPTMATRKDVLAKLGGIGVLGEYHSDDYVLGKLVAAGGWEVVLSHHVVEHVVLSQTLGQSLLHQARWMNSARFARPLGHLGSGLTYAVPYGLLGFIAGVASSHPGVGVTTLIVAFANRVVQALAVGWGIVDDPEALRYCWLYPLRDLIGAMLWAWSFVAGGTIMWRGEQYRLVSGGRIVRVGTSPPPEPPAPRRGPAAAEISR